MIGQNTFAVQLSIDVGPQLAQCVHNERKCGTYLMNLGMVLHLNNMNRNTYTTLNRRTGLRFMKRAFVEGASRNRFTFVHAAALGCMVAFQNAGVEAKRASDVVDELLGFIDGIVDGLASGRRDADRAWLTIINYAEGTWGWAGGSQNADTFGVGAVESKVTVNVLAVWDKMALRFGEPRLEPDAQEDADD